MAEKYELDRWAAVVCNGFTAVNVMSSGNVEELGWDYTEMELDPTGTCGLFDGMLLDWDDDTPAERRDHEAYFPDAFTVGARILADDWDHELGNDEVRSRCFAIIEDADQFTDHDTARDWLCESTMADFSEVEARTFFQNLTLMDSEEIAKLDGRPIIPSAGADECRAFGIAAGAVRTSASTGVERNGLHFYYGDEPKPGPEFFRERHSKTRPIVCLETGETFDGNPAAARPLHVSPATISQAVRYGTPVAGLHFYHGDEPKPAPEFFKPIKPERGKSPMQMAAAARAAAGNPGRPDGGQRPRRAV